MHKLVAAKAKINEIGVIESPEIWSRLNPGWKVWWLIPTLALDYIKSAKIPLFSLPVRELSH